MTGDAHRQAKLAEARKNYERVLQAHPYLAQLEEMLIDHHRQRVGKRPERPQEWQSHLAALEEERSAYLRKHRIPEDFGQPKWDCRLCNDTGLLKGQLCRCERQRILEARFRGSRLPEKLQYQTFNTFDLAWYKDSPTALGLSERENAERVLAACREFVENAAQDVRRTPGLFISGGTGLGKTFLCSAICHGLLERGVLPLYTVFSDLLADIRSSFQANAAFSEGELMDMARRVPVLLLDDLGAEQVTEFVTNRLFDIVNYRRNEQLPIVISSNLTLGEVSRLYSERIGSRLGETCQLLMLYGTDIRHQQLVRAQHRNARP